MTANQRVAANITRLRKGRGWTQHEAAARFAELVGGEPMSKASWSAMESTVRPGARRVMFDADEIEAFAVLFDVPPADLLAEHDTCPTCGAPWEAS